MYSVLIHNLLVRTPQQMGTSCTIHVPISYIAMLVETIFPVKIVCLHMNPSSMGGMLDTIIPWQVSRA